MTRSRDVANIDTILSTKGDIYAASAAYTPTRLGVGNNGETLVADSSQTTGLRYNPPVGSLANPIINGGFDIWQRGTSFTGTAYNYSADRWLSFRGSFASGSTFSRQSSSATGTQYAMRLARDNGNTSTTTIVTRQALETVNSIPFQGKTITLSWYARKGANYSGSDTFATIYGGTGTDQAPQSMDGSWTGQTTIANGSINSSITTSWQRFAITGTVGSSITQIGVDFGWVPTGTAGANDWLEISGIQIDVGTWTASTAPTFRRSGGTLAGELAACQRYYLRLTGTNTYSSFGVGWATSTTTGVARVTFPVQMRTAPSTSLDVGGSFRWTDEVSQFTASNLFISNTEQHNLSVIIGGTSSTVTQYRPLYLTASNDATAYLGFSAEL